MRYVLFLVLTVASLESFATEFDLVGTRPFVSLTKGVAPRWDLNAFYSETINASDKTFRHQHTAARDFQSYFQTGLTFKYSPTLNFTVGYVFQRNNPFYKDFSNENRIWEQVIFSQAVSYFIFTHRLRYEQRYIENRATEHTDPVATRLRYQLSFTAPLQGKEIDPGEYFFNTYNESYFSITGQRNAWYSENWTYAGIGYQTQRLGRVEIGPLAQWAKVNRQGDTRVFYLLQVGWSYGF